jgi:hypothetical protein
MNTSDVEGKLFRQYSAEAYARSLDHQTLRRTCSFSRIKLSWHMPDVRPVASSSPDVEAVFCRQSLSFREIGLLGLRRGVLHQSG